MKITIISIGKFENSPHKQVFEHYLKRINQKIELKELDLKNSKNLEINKIKAQEAELIKKSLGKNSFVISLDEKGKQFSSLEFADFIAKKSVSGISQIDFIIGGAFGIAEEISQNSNLTISLGKMTLPHLMARSVLLEQIYRAFSIISGHPYHKE